jgi:hypothetical protein
VNVFVIKQRRITRGQEYLNDASNSSELFNHSMAYDMAMAMASMLDINKAKVTHPASYLSLPQASAKAAPTADGQCLPSSKRRSQTPP